ncbi:hypothetical protein GIB67_016066 [Kingdonia uniflora]|uniref:DZANK-type domain-containing protein n=1 Tax=Kingdonia uniflora TaxID=39325 RepID=A0A7J7L1U7_9MAGN|nr:hypothetical protein GIB67_016066 [Kingdonia uniflora]
MRFQVSSITSIAYAIASDYLDYNKNETLVSLTVEGEFDDVLFPLLAQHNPLKVFKMAVDFLISKTSHLFYQNNFFKIMDIFFKEGDTYKYVQFELSRLEELEESKLFKLTLALSEEESEDGEHCKDWGESYVDGTSGFCTKCSSVQRHAGVVKHCLNCGEAYEKETSNFCSECGRKRAM